MEIEDRKDRIWRERSRGMSKKVAAFLSDFHDDLISEGFTDGDVVADILSASAPVVMEMAMKGIFR